MPGGRYPSSRGPWHLECCWPGAYRAVVLLSHTGFCRGQRRCTELRLLQRCARGWPWYVTKWRPIPGRGLPRLASPPSGTEAGGIPCPAIARPLLLRKIPGGGWQAGLAYSSLSPTGTAAAPHAAARHQVPTVIRNALRALSRIFTCSCIRGQREERHEAATTRQLPEMTGDSSL